MRITIVTALATFCLLAACAAPSPAQRQRNNAALPDYILCEQLAIATLAPTEMRAEWAMELQRRGEDCRKYEALLTNAVRQNQQMIQNGQAALQRMQQPASLSAPVGPSSGLICFSQREWISGFNKNCVYSCLGSEVVQTIGATALCSQFITR